MFDIDKWKEILNTLMANPLRTSLTAIGVGWGVFMLVVMLWAASGLQNGVTSEFSGTATNSFFMWSRSTTKAFKGLPVGRRLDMNNDDYKAIIQNVPEAGIVCPQNQLGGHRGAVSVDRKGNTGAFSVVGNYPKIINVEPIKVVHGRFLNQYDMDDRRKVAVIGEWVQKELFEKDEEPLGEYIRINGVYFQVVGVFGTYSSGDQGERQTKKIHIPFSTIQQTFNYGDEIGWFAITSKAGYPASLVEDRVKELLKARHKVHPKDRRAFGSWNMEEEFNQIQGLFTGISFLVWFVGIGTLLAGVIGVSNIMLIIVKERTKEIGIRRSIGATPWSIKGQIIAEAIILTAMAGFLGLASGSFLLEMISSLVGLDTLELDMFKRPEVAVSVVTKSIGILVVAGAFAGLLPASRATAIRPVEALRIEG